MAPAASSAREARVRTCRGEQREEAARGREMSEREEGHSTAPGVLIREGKLQEVARHHRRTATQVVLPSGRRRKKGREKK